MTESSHDSGALLLACHAPAALRRIETIAENVQVRATLDPSNLPALSAAPASILCIDTHGYRAEHIVGRRGGPTIPVAELSGRADILVLNICYQSEEFAREWAHRYSARAVLHATGSAQMFTGTGGLVRVLEDPESWTNPELALRRIVDDSPPRATAHRDAGWRITEF